MENVVLNITIGQREKSEAFLNFYKEQGINLSLGTFGKGTASKETLEILGIGSSEKCVIFSFVSMERSGALLDELEKRMSLRKVGVGLSFTIPLSKIDSLSNLKRLVGDIDTQKESEGYSVETENELIVIVANRGYVENVMQVARDAGAPGGTVVHARGTGHEASEKFFGTIIGAEKEMIFIVTKTEKSKQIIQAIKDNVGVNTPSDAVVFSLPVQEVAGLITT